MGIKDFFTDLLGSTGSNSPMNDEDDDDLEGNQVVGSDGTIIDLGNNSHGVIHKVIKK